MAPHRVANKTAFATIESTTDTSNFSNTVLLFLNLKISNNDLKISNNDLKISNNDLKISQ